MMKAILFTLIGGPLGQIYRDKLGECLHRSAKPWLLAGGHRLQAPDLGGSHPGLMIRGGWPIRGFVIPAGVSVYGGFAGYGNDRDQRNPKKYQTILTGAADAERNSTVVRMGNNSVLDGFTVTGAGNTEGPGYCVYGSGVDFTLEQCIVADSDGYGIRASNGNITIRWCEIKNCVDDGIRHEGSGFSLNIDNSWIMKKI